MRERLLEVFERGAARPLPWVADLTYWHSAHAACGTLDARYEGEEGLIRLHADLGCTLYFDYLYKPWDVVEETAEVSTEGDRTCRVTTWRCRAGTLRQMSRYLQEAFCWAVVEYPVKTPADLAVVREIVRGRRYVPNPQRYLARQAAVGELGLPCVILPRAPLAALMAEWAGVMGACYLVADAPGEVEETLSALREEFARGLQAAVGSPAPLLHLGDNLSAQNVGSLFDRYLQEDYECAARALHGAGKYVAVHLDGTLRGLLGRLAQTGVDAIESITPKPVGDMALEELRAAAGEKVILWGGVPGAMFAPPFTVKDIDCQVECIRGLFEDRGRFIVGSADQVPPNGDIRRVRRIAERLGLV